MKASDVMVRNVIATHPQASVSEVAKVLVDNDISALPVVNDAGRVAAAPRAFFQIRLICGPCPATPLSFSSSLAEPGKMRGV